jgi:GT2 family glycosyltransferase
MSTDEIITKTKEASKLKKKSIQKWPKVAIIILNWNGWKDTIECLESLLKVQNVKFEVVLIDNGSFDDSVEKIEDWIRFHSIPKFKFSYPQAQKLIDNKCKDRQVGMQRIILFSLSENIGFCAGNNLGLKQAYINNIPYAIILNNDTVVDKNFLFPLVKYAETYSDIGLLGGQIRYADEPETVWWAGGIFNFCLGIKYLYHNQQIEKVPIAPFFTDWISGCMTFIPLSIFSKIGGYNELFFIWCDEWDLSLRVSKAGYKLATIPTSVIYHKVGKTLGKMSPLTYYYSGRNLLLLRHRYLPLWKQIFFFTMYFPYKFLQSILYTIKFKDYYFIFYWDMVLDFYFNHFGKWRRHDTMASKIRVK